MKCDRRNSMKKFNRYTVILCSSALLLTGCSGNQPTESAESRSAPETTGYTEEATESDIIDSLNNGIVIDEVSGNVYKTEQNANPISGSIFGADPTAVEYNGRLYVYGTNDQQQSELDTKNDYDHIDSLVIFSTDDMVNWIYITAK